MLYQPFICNHFYLFKIIEQGGRKLKAMVKWASGHRRTVRSVHMGRRRPQAAHPQGIEGSGMAGLGETLESPWSPLAMRLWCQSNRRGLHNRLSM
jgi:hypothetical protein